MSGQSYITFDDSFPPNTVPETKETVASQVKRLAAEGKGWEDICVVLKKEGLRLSPNGKQRVRHLVLHPSKHDGLRQPGELSGGR